MKLRIVAGLSLLALPLAGCGDDSIEDLATDAVVYDQTSDVDPYLDSESETQVQIALIDDAWQTPGVIAAECDLIWIDINNGLYGDQLRRSVEYNLESSAGFDFTPQAVEYVMSLYRDYCGI